jgi:hypothetical protein
MRELANPQKLNYDLSSTSNACGSWRRYYPIKSFKDFLKSQEYRVKNLKFSPETHINFWTSFLDVWMTEVHSLASTGALNSEWEKLKLEQVT